MNQLHQQQNRQQPLFSDHVPARVRHATELINLFTEKTMDRAAIGPMGTDILPGQKLTHEESAVSAAACACLVDYFSGQLDRNEYESLQLSIDAQSLCSDEGDSHSQPTSVINAPCSACGGQDDPVNPVSKCGLCLGTYLVQVICPEPIAPTSSDSSQD